jgi:hypothetical protein
LEGFTIADVKLFGVIMGRFLSAHVVNSGVCREEEVIERD